MNQSTLQRRGFTLWQVVLMLATLVILAAFLFPIFGRVRNPNKGSCQSNLKQIGLGFKQYIQDYDEKYPLVASGGKANSGRKGDFAAFGWADELQPYLKSTLIFQCPRETSEPQTDPTQRNYTDYWLNARASGVPEAIFDFQSRTILLGDGNDGTDDTSARYHLMGIPDAWRQNQNSPLYRHLDGANFAFADGHVKWLNARRWQQNGLDSGDYFTKATFRLKPTN